VSLSSRLNVAWSRYLAPVRFFGRLIKPPEPTTGEVKEQGVGVLGSKTATMEVAGEVIRGPMPGVYETLGDIRGVLDVVR
jgi:hypothetical protein